MDENNSKSGGLKGTAQWSFPSLSEIATIASGGTPSRGEPRYWNGEIPWVKISDMSGMYVTTTDEFITEDGLSNSSAKIFDPGTILYSIFATIGKVGILDIHASTNQAIAGITPSEHIDNRFLYYALINVTEELKRTGQGVAQNNINSTKLRAAKIPLPPLAEQKRIVAKLDALMEEVDAAREKLDSFPETIKQFRQSVLEQAISGKLTESWRDENTLDWQSSSIGEKSLLITKGASPKWQGINYVDDYNDDSILFITSENVEKFSIVESKFKYVEISFNEKQKRSILHKGDVLTNIVGGSIGRSTVWSSEDRANINQAVCLIRPDSNEYVPQYLAIYLNSNTGLKSIFNDVVDVARANISLGDIRNMIISWPSIIEQKEIVRKVEALFAYADQLEEAYERAKASIDQLPQSILAKAFRGQLVPQDPNDEPASVLLERIKEERAKPKAKKEKKGKAEQLSFA